MSLERSVSFGRNAVLGLGALVFLNSCAGFEVPIRATEEVIKTVYRLATLPPSPISPFFGNYEPSLDECVETEYIKVCKSYISEVDLGGLEEEYFTVLKIDKRIPRTLLVLGYFDGNNYGFSDPDQKLLVVVAYSGESTEDLIDPYYGNMSLDYGQFMGFFERPRGNTFDESENQFKNAVDRGFIDDIEFGVLRKILKEIMQRGLELADEQLPKSNE